MFTTRQIALIAAVAVLASLMMIGLTYLVIDRFVFASSDPLYKAGGLSPSQNIK